MVNMDYDYSWNSLLRPGQAEDFFCFAEKIAPFRPETGEYCPSNAWWLSELSRLIYRRGEDEISICANPISRNDLLKKAGLKENLFVNTQGLSYALVSDEKESFAILVFRGTSRFEHWFSNLHTVQTQWPYGGMVHTGFKYEFDKIRDELSEILSPVRVPLFYTGHSLGGALATLTASFRPPAAVYTFGSPRVGNGIFRNSLASVNLYRIAMENDVVTTVPPSRSPFDFCHAGEAKVFPFPNHRKPCLGKDCPISESSDFSEKPDLIKNFYRKMYEGLFMLNTAGLTVFSLMKQFTDAPYFLAAHSPVNYSACLAHAV